MKKISFMKHYFAFIIAITFFLPSLCDIQKEEKENKNNIIQALNKKYMKKKKNKKAFGFDNSEKRKNFVPSIIKNKGGIQNNIALKNKQGNTSYTNNEKTRTEEKTFNIPNNNFINQNNEEEDDEEWLNKILAEIESEK